MLRDEYVTRFGALDQVTRAIPHDGVLDDDGDELSRFGAEGTPLVMVVLAGMQDIELIGDKVRAKMLFGAYVVAADGDERLKTPADRSPGDLAMVVAAAMVVELAAGASFPAGCKRPADITSSNFFSTELAKLGLSLWMVRWSQLELLDASQLAAIADTLRQLHVDYHLEPTGDAPYGPPDLTDDITY